jgi:battenin
MCSSNVLFICFWVFGLTTNFAYVVMLSSAIDILSTDIQNQTTANTTNNRYDCNTVSAGAVLIADILPGMIFKLIAPFFVHRIKYSIRVYITACLTAFSFLIVALTPPSHKWLAFVGISFASMGSSFGEITFLSLSTTYDNIQTISGWSSGTGTAGLGGSLSYAGLTAAHVSPRNTILIMLVVPIFMLMSYAVLSKLEINQYEKIGDNEKTDSDSEAVETGNLLTQRTRLIGPLLKYMIPLFVVYLAEYFINQGLFELLYFKNAFLEHKDQYRWYSVCYQLTVFISRSSISFVKIKFLPIFSILQVVNVAALLLQIFYGYISSIWIVFLIILWEGLLGGSCYVNAFYRVSVEIPKNVRESSIAIASIASDLGIALSGFLAIPVHNAICEYGKQKL